MHWHIHIIHVFIQWITHMYHKYRTKTAVNDTHMNLYNDKHIYIHKNIVKTNPKTADDVISTFLSAIYCT